ncbi:MAG TPA: DUF6340 family protein [Bacteroidales bacterium]|nr:DUF6340 family protein [Bacteroidales bacterium]
MKRKYRILYVITLIILASSCTTVVQMQRTYPPEKELQADSVKFVFVNFFDYRIPESIKDKYEVAYAIAVRGFIDGLGKTILMDPKESFAIGDTLKSGFSVSSMQLPEFTDTVRAICSAHGADMLIALDSINLVMDWDVNLEENDEGGEMLVKNFYLYANNYMTLYTSDGEVIDRCAGEKSTYVKSKYTIFGMIGGPTIAKARETVRSLSHDAAKDCIGKFYPFTETYTETLYKGGPLNKINELIISGHPEEAVEPLKALINSSDQDLAKKASSNLDIVNRILANRRETEQIMKDFTR